MITELKGDIIKLALNGHFDVIVHGCNCFHTMNSGLAKQIKDTFLDAYIADKSTSYGKESKLGTCSFAECGDLVIVNLYSQFRYGKGSKVDYDALRKGLYWVEKSFEIDRIGIPHIGCGLAHGDWNIVKKIIDETIGNLDVTIVEYDK